VSFPPVPAGVTYQLNVQGDSLVRATATAGQNYLRPPLRVATGAAPPSGAPVTLEVAACDALRPACCATQKSTVTVNIIEACTTPVAPTASNLVISEYVVKGEGSGCPNFTSCQAGEAVELTNLSNCPIALDGFHFAYRNPTSASDSYRWMNFGTGDVVPPRGVYVAIRGRPFAPTCSAPLALAMQNDGLYGLRVSSLEMQGAFLDSGWFNNSGGGSSLMQVAPGTVPDAGVTDFSMPITQVAPYLGTAPVCGGVGFNAVNSCGDLAGGTTPTNVLIPNQLGRLWHPCDALPLTPAPNPACVRD